MLPYVAIPLDTLPSLPSISSVPPIFLSILSFFFLYILFTFFILPLKRLQFYKNQGIVSHFIPFLGYLATLKNGEKIHGDTSYYIKQNAKQNPHMELEAYTIGSKPIVLLYSPRILKAFLSSDEPYEKYKKLQAITLFSKLGFAALKGRIFREHRKIVSSLFSYNNLSDKLPKMQRNAINALDKIVENKDFKGTFLQHYTLQFSSENFSDVFFGGVTKTYTVEGKNIMNYTIDIQADAGQLTRTWPLVFFGNGIVKLGLLPSHRDFNRRVKLLKAEVHRLIQERKQKGDNGENDLLKILLDTQQSKDPDVLYTDEMIVGEYTSLFVSSAENPSHMITNCLYMLATHPEFKQQLLQEIKDVYCSQPLSSQVLHSMKLLHALIQETLRLHSPSVTSQPRVSVKDFNLENYQIKKGTILMPIYYHQNYNETVYKDATKFKPERWLDEKFYLEPFRFIPFSAGPRNCIGQHLSMLEIKLMICEFLIRYDYEIDPNYVLRKTQRFLNVPTDPIPFNLTRK